MIKFFKKHWEVLSYLIFGVLTTLLNIVLYALFSQLFGYTAANSWGNVLDNALCILFAYCTNRAFVFRSKTTGKAMAKEFGTFVTCRLGTMVLDAAIMIVGGNLLAAQGAALVDTAMQGLLGAVAGWLGPDTTLYMANSFAGSHAAIQMSGATQLLFGIKGRRWDDHPVISKLYNPAWVRPDESEGITNKEKVEGGSYW